MSRKFVTERELTQLDRWTRELMQHVVVQTILYYAVDPEATRVHDLYDEAIEKVWRPPVEVSALVQYDNPSTRSTGAGPDRTHTFVADCHTQELIERNVVPREGDFVEYGQLFFEISSVTQPAQAFGQANKRHLTRLTCVPSRQGQFQAGSVASENVDRSHPLQPSKPGPRGGNGGF